jgi:hypothetical protein
VSRIAATRRIAAHPFLFAAYGVLALLAVNVDQLDVWDGVRPLLLALLAAGLVYLALGLLVRNSRKAALLATVGVLAFFSYGHVYLYLEQAGAGLGRHRYLLPLVVILLAAAALWILRTRSSLEAVTRGLTWIGALLLIAPLLRIAVFQVRLAQAGMLPGARTQDAAPAAARGDLPDIYYIVPDEYPRADTLAGAYGFDNSSFLQSLREMGFYVAEQSRSNYGQTELSLASSLNMDYLDALIEDLDPASTDTTPLLGLMRNNDVRARLEALGYQTVAFETGFAWTQWKDADVYFTRNQLLGGAAALGGMNAFEEMLLETTALSAVNDAAARLPRWLRQQAPESHNRNHYDLVMYVLGQLEQTPRLEGPKFVFVHLIIPHPPFVVRADGSFAGEDESFGLSSAYGGDPTTGFRDQLIFLNSWLEEFLPTLTDGADRASVILLQSDTGPGLSPALRMNNLSAYFFPGRDYAALYPSITPVNSFRVVFNEFLGEDLPLLEDESYFSTYAQPFKFKRNP